MLGGDQEVNYTDDDYTSSEYFLTDDPITYGDGSGGSNGLYSDRFVFDFQDILEEATTNITSLTITATITTSGSSSTSDISIHSTSLLGGTYSGIDTGPSELKADRTLTANGQTTVSWTTTGIGTNHSGSFLPVWVAFRCTDNPGPNFQYDDVTMQITFTGKTLLRTGSVQNDSITYKQINGSSPVTYDGVTYAAGAEVRIGTGQIFKASPFNNGTDELRFVWNAGRFSNRGEGYTVEGMSIKEYIQMVTGASGVAEFQTRNNIMPGGRVCITDEVNYQMTQDGTGVGSVFTAQKRLWKADDSRGEITANAGLSKDALAVPNFLGDQSISNIDNDDISTAITLTTEYTSADVDDRYLQFYDINIDYEIEFRNGTKGSPTGNTAYKDLYGVDFGGGSYVESYRNYRSTPVPRNTKAFLEFFYRPTLTATPDALDLSTTWTNSGLIGITHGMTSSDVGTYTATSSASALGGFLLEGASTPTASFTADFRGGFQLSVIEEETTTATLTATANVSMTAESSITSTATASIDGSLVFFPDWGVITPTFSYSQTDSGIGVVHGMSLSDVGAMIFSMTGVVVGAKIDEPDPFRTHTFIAQTRSIPVSAQTRISTVAQQTRSIPVGEQTRIETADTQTRTLKITGYNT
jgi:hypothetical protein